ncbi:PRELI domain-containing protein 1, mitochondrial-like [Oppia nitens]|uniref:PRELI domain-containing protein 1, mitochondrial-like n=1 Tax=Oppia nitens TaxID=1686743 RepID=UPI0023DA857A|nr:PRELI domain-containing protein 1, mitochondrial-like [Oppia nitens]
MRYYETSHTFRYNWEQVSKAFWCRYPNPFSSHVLTEDVVQRKVDESGKLLTKRLISKTNSAPKWTERFLSSKLVFIIEESILDPKCKTLTTYTRNIGLKHLMTLEEKVTYKSSDDDKEWTVAERKAWIDSNVFGLSAAVQRFGLERFKKNVSKTCQGFNFVLNTLYGNLNADQLVPTFDNRLNQIHPLLKEKLKEKALKAHEFAAVAKSKAVPIVAAVNEMANNGNRQES